MSTTLTRSTCCYCGVGCGVLIGTRPGPDGAAQVVSVQGDPDHPANFGRLCTKGSTLHLSAAPEVYAQTRVHAPELRRQRQFMTLLPERVRRPSDIHVDDDF